MKHKSNGKSRLSGISSNRKRTKRIILVWNKDTVEGVENNGDNLTTNEPTTADTVRFFFGVFDADLPTFVFLRGALLFFAMVAMNVGVVIFIQSGG